MRITHSFKNLITVVLLLLAQLPGQAQDSLFTSQPAGRGKYALVLYLNGGLAFFASSRGLPAYLNPQVSRINPVATARILWHPDHLLKVGLESGHISFFNYKITDSAGRKGTVALDAVPVLLVWSMSVTRNFNIFAGSGAYFLKTRLNYQGHTSARKFSVGWMAAASYILPLGKNSGLGTEFKWLYASETTNGSLCLQLQYVWKFANW
ncbi:MAG: hypothetical protein EOO15_12105 [Chitinophagaceae bacterium]|nr:MAG: hypothetical protein EOO15_12105 [Chitinophagaceae bacterium]